MVPFGGAECHSQGYPYPTSSNISAVLSYQGTAKYSNSLKTKNTTMTKLNV